MTAHSEKTLLQVMEKLLMLKWRVLHVTADNSTFVENYAINNWYGLLAGITIAAIIAGIVLVIMLLDYYSTQHHCGC